MKIKFQYGGEFAQSKAAGYPGLQSLSLKPITPLDLNQLHPVALPQIQVPQNLDIKLNSQQKNSSSTNQVLASGIQSGASVISDELAKKLKLSGDFGTLFSQASSSALGTMGSNLLKGQALTEGLGQDVGSSLSGTVAGIAANYAGKGITSLIGNNYTGRAVGAGAATGLGTVGGTALGALANGANVGTAISNINPYALVGNILGSALSAGNGPSKEYGGKYGNVTKTMDSIYSIAASGIGMVPGGQLISAGMMLNKGLSNLFGSTDGMTKQDAILGSAFMPAPVKWANMWGSSKTGTFNNQSWQNQQKADSFMGNAFGNLGDKFDKARQEAGKTYGTFSQGAKKKAQNNIDFANTAWKQIMDMADQNEYQNIRSQYMSSINNQKYAQMIQGGWSPLARGKQGMKILNNATNHNIGMRLLSGAALIDDKQMILCSVVD